MAAPGSHVGHFIQRNSRFLRNNFEQLWGHRGVSWTPALRQQAAEVHKETTETIVIPRKKTWSKEAVLEALASTVSRDPTAYPYQFQDDPFLSPRTFVEFKTFTLSLESGRAAAKYFINSNPKLFSKDFAEPHIPSLMPDAVSPSLEEVSEEALKERISLLKVTAAVDLYDQLLQAGTAVSMETTHDLLDLLCFYCNRDPIQKGQPQMEQTDGSGEEVKTVKENKLRVSDIMRLTWKENNNAERIFYLLPERDTRCYSALIRGMVMYGASAKAFSLYTDMLNNRLTADVHIFNALISAAPDVREKHYDRWMVIKELLTQMTEQKVQPNLRTFNSVLKALKSCGPMAKAHASHTLNEMKALGITPSLASFHHFLAVFPKGDSCDKLQEVMSQLVGTSQPCLDPDDAKFFVSAMKICLDHKDVELAYTVRNLTEVGENWRLLGGPLQRGYFNGCFFSLVCLMENIDVVLKWYRELIPSLYYPNFKAMRDLLQALDTDSRLDLLPDIWKDMHYLGLDKHDELVEELLSLMARDQHSPEVQEAFAVCALDVKNALDGTRGKKSQELSTSSLSYITYLLLRANKTQQAWDMLQFFKSSSKVPQETLLEDFLSVCHSQRSPQRAVELVQLSAAFCLADTPTLAKRTLAGFDLTEEQRAILSELE